MFDPFFNPPVPFLAIDLSDRSVKFARVQRRKGKRRLVDALRADLPEKLVVSGRAQDPEALAKVIAGALSASSAHGLRAHAAAMTLPEEHCFIRTIRVPKLSRRELAQAIRWEAESALPLPPAEAVVSWQVLEGEKGADHLDVLVAGAPLDIVEPYADVLRRLSLLPVAFEPESFAVARALLGSNDRDPVLIIDFGREHTGVIITDDGAVRVTANIPIAARVFTERIAEAKKIPLQRAEEMKRTHGIAPEGEGAGIRDILAPVLKDIVTQIEQFLAYFETHGHVDVSVKKGEERPAADAEAPHRILRIVLAGGDALLKGLPEYIAQQLLVSAEVGNPFRNLESVPKNAERHPLYATVIGLALYEPDLHSL